MTTEMRWFALFPFLLAGCAASEDPELACQTRLVEIRNVEPVEPDGVAGDPFAGQAYAALDRTGCTPAQVTRIERLAQLAKALPGLADASDRIGRSGDSAAHMAAFQKMNDALIELDDLEQGARADLQRLRIAAEH